MTSFMLWPLYIQGKSSWYKLCSSRVTNHPILAGIPLIGVMKSLFRLWDGQIKVNLKVHTVTSTKAQRRGIGVILSFLNLGALWGWVVNVIPRPVCSHKRAPVAVVEEAGWASWLMWMCMESLAPIRVWTPNCPAVSELLYQLHYLQPHWDGQTGYALLTECDYPSVCISAGLVYYQERNQNTKLVINRRG